MIPYREFRGQSEAGNERDGNGAGAQTPLLATAEAEHGRQLSKLRERGGDLLDAAEAARVAGDV
jgi:hypothetical protein